MPSLRSLLPAAAVAPSNAPRPPSKKPSPAIHPKKQCHVGADGEYRAAAFDT